MLDIYPGGVIPLYADKAEFDESNGSGKTAGGGVLPSNAVYLDPLPLSWAWIPSHVLSSVMLLSF
jgi:hypothetical protein